MFCIDTEELRLQLEVVPVKSLSQHEEIIPSKANQLMLEFKNWTELENPIIVDKNHIVLDGHHRVYVFKKLQFTYISVCKIDYHNECVQLRYWFRHLENVESIDALKRLIRAMQGNIREVEDREALKRELEKNKFHCGIQHGDFFALVSFRKSEIRDAVSAYRIAERLQDHLVEGGASLRYVPCQVVCEGDSCEELKRDELIIWTPQISKEMVVEAVKKEKVFAPKTTRHLIPARPLNLNIPTKWFKENISLEDINKRFVAFLEKKRVKRFAPGQIVNGRYYEEELFVFYDGEE